MAFLSDSKLLFQTHAEQIAGSAPSGSINCNSHKMHNECQKGGKFQYATPGPFPTPNLRSYYISALATPLQRTHHALCSVCCGVNDSIDATTKAANECVSTANLR